LRGGWERGSPLASGLVHGSVDASRLRVAVRSLHPAADVPKGNVYVSLAFGRTTDNSVLILVE
jgi:hypothetical protein